MTGPRDLIGYGPTPPDPRWPGGARVCVQFVINYEEGGERSVLYGDRESEATPNRQTADCRTGYDVFVPYGGSTRRPKCS